MLLSLLARLTFLADHQKTMPLLRRLARSILPAVLGATTLAGILALPAGPLLAQSVTQNGFQAGAAYKNPSGADVDTRFLVYRISGPKNQSNTLKS